MPAYYNENAPFPAKWLRNLIAAGHLPAGEVDERSIVDVLPDDLKPYTQCHFFAGIGGWSYALRLAGWPDDRPVWTGSCPCQPFSSAARGVTTGRTSPKHLWPAWRLLISASKPVSIFGEQVANAGDWFDEVCDDLEALDYAVGAAILPACSVGKDHARARLWFVGNANSNGESSVSVDAKASWVQESRGHAGELVLTHGISSRVGRLRAYGNAIVPQVAAEFIGAFMDCRP